MKKVLRRSSSDNREQSANAKCERVSTSPSDVVVANSGCRQRQMRRWLSTLAALKAAVPDGAQEDAIKAAPHLLTHLACTCPATSHHLFEQSELSGKRRRKERLDQSMQDTNGVKERQLYF